MENTFEVLENRMNEIQREISYWTEVLQKSEKYERLMQDDDFKELLKDLQPTVDAHDREIKSCLEGMSEYTVKLEQDAFHSIRTHQILKEQVERAMKRPQEVLELAKKARVKVPELQEQLTQLKEQLSHAR